MYYAQINSSGIVYAVTQTSGEMSRDDMIKIESLDLSLIGKLYQGGTFIEAPEI